MTVLLPSWLRSYERTWLRADAIAGVVIWSVVTPQAVAYAQIAGLPPEAGLMAAPVAMAAYALAGTSRQLIVSATTATSAVSAAAIGPLAGGDVGRFAALSAAFALVVAVTLVLSGVLRFGAIADLVSKPVMTGFLFGLGMVIVLAQVPSALGVEPGDGNFFPALVDVLDELGSAHGATVAIAAGSIAALLAGRRLAPSLPSTLVVLAASIALSAVLRLEDHGVAVVGAIPGALPDPAIPQVSADDIVALIAPAFGVTLLTAEAVGVARALAVRHGYEIEPSRDLMALGAANAAAGLTSGFVQSGGASQTAAADAAGGRTQLAALIAAGLTLLTGAFLAPLFADLPQATLAAIVIVAVAGFFDVAELRRIARIRRSAIAFALTALAGVLVLGVLQGLVVATGLSLAYVVARLSRPSVTPEVRDPATGAWGPGGDPQDGVLVVRCNGPLLYANTNAVKAQVTALAAPARVVVLDLEASTEIDVQSADMLLELAHELDGMGKELRLARVQPRALALLARAGVTDRVPIGQLDER